MNKNEGKVTSSWTHVVWVTHPSGRLLSIALAGVKHLAFIVIYIGGPEDEICSWNDWSARLLFDMNPPQLPGPFQVEQISVRGVQVVNFFCLSCPCKISKRTNFFDLMINRENFCGKRTQRVHMCAKMCQTTIPFNQFLNL